MLKIAIIFFTFLAPLTSHALQTHGQLICVAWDEFSAIDPALDVPGHNGFPDYKGVPKAPGKARFALVLRDLGVIKLFIADDPTGTMEASMKDYYLYVGKIASEAHKLIIINTAKNTLEESLAPDRYNNCRY